MADEPRRNLVTICDTQIWEEQHTNALVQRILRRLKNQVKAPTQSVMIVHQKHLSCPINVKKVK